MRWWQRLTGGNAVSLAAWLLTLPGAVFTPALTVARNAQPVSWYWLALGAVGHCLFGGVLFVAWVWVWDLGANGSHPVAYFLVVVLGGVLRGGFLAIAGVWLGIAPDPDWFLRLASAPVTLLVWYSLAALLVDGSRRHRAAMSRLRADFVMRQQMAEASADRLRHQQDETLQRIGSLVNEQLRLALALSTVPEVAAQQLHLIVDQVIRPLSRELESRTSSSRRLLKDAAVGGREGHPPLRAYLRHSTSVNPFSPQLSSVIVIGTSFILTIAAFGPILGMLYLAIQGIAFAGASAVASRWFEFRRVPGVRVGAVVLVWAAIALVNSASGALVMYRFDSANSQESLAEWVAVVVVWFGLGFLAQVASAVNSAVTLLRERAEDDLKAAATAIAWAEARLRQRTWAGQVRLSRVLHGEVQARIVSAALQLQLHPPEDPLSHIEQLNLAIQSALRQRTDTSFSTSLEHLHALWGSAIDFTIDVDPEALRLLDTDPDGAQAVSEVVREATTNAVRHGDADCVHVRVLAVDNWIEVVVTDDGCGVAQLRGSGLGSELFDALTMEWSIEGQPGARFTARIASADTQREVLK